LPKVWDITDGLKSGTPDWEESVGRFKYEWDWNLKMAIAAGTSKTIKYSTVAIVPSRIYATDLMVDVHETDIKDNYIWPAAFVFVNDVFDVTFTDDEGNELPVSLQVWIGSEDGLINSWPTP
tara:strand:+ start:2095 stop:2460 length:366 start_codon:yes stop_codon:yes gene_type:complete